MTTQQITGKLRTLWEFNFRNKNKRTGEYGPRQTIHVAVAAVRRGAYTKYKNQKDEAVRKFTGIVETMYPAADQIVSDYGPLKMRVFA